jgi:hypothetical protein
MSRETLGIPSNQVRERTRLIGRGEIFGDCMRHVRPCGLGHTNRSGRKRGGRRISCVILSRDRVCDVPRDWLLTQDKPQRIECPRARTMSWPKKRTIRTLDLKSRFENSRKSRPISKTIMILLHRLVGADVTLISRPLSHNFEPKLGQRIQPGVCVTLSPFANETKPQG